MILKNFKIFGRAQLVVEDSINQSNTVFHFKIVPLLHTTFMKSESQILQKKTQIVLEVYTFNLSGVCINFFPITFFKSKNFTTTEASLWVRASSASTVGLLKKLQRHGRPNSYLKNLAGSVAEKTDAFYQSQK